MVLVFIILSKIYFNMPGDYESVKRRRLQILKKCMNCGKNPPRDGKNYCHECTDKKSWRDRERYKRKKLEKINSVSAPPIDAIDEVLQNGADQLVGEIARCI